MPRKRKEKSEFERLPMRVRRVIDRCRSGQKLCKQMRKKETGESDVTFVFEPSEKRAPQKSSAMATQTTFLRPLGDGLFGADFSQTWEAA